MNNTILHLSTIDSEDTKNVNIQSLFLRYWKAIEEYPNCIDMGMGMPSPSIFGSELEAQNEFVEGRQLWQADYQQQAGDKNLREAFSQLEKQRTGISYTVENVMIVSGALRGFSLVLDCLTRKKTHIIEIVPTYPLLAGQVRNVLERLGGTLTTIIPKDTKTFQITLDEVLPHIKSDSVIYLTNPNNPTGIYIPDNVLFKIIATCEEVGAYIILDEACDIPFNLNYHQKFYLDSPVVIRILSLSKTYLLAGFRLGYIVAHPELIETFSNTYSFSDGNAPLIANKAIMKYLNTPHLMSFISQIFRNKVKLASHRFSKCSSITEFIEPEACFYIFLKINYSKNSWFLFKELLAQGINVVPGCLFSVREDPWIRVCCCHEDDILIDHLDKLSKALDAL
ncbi:pyridoxal phosphate-dependent aminotransferase [Scytonema sp. NUACC21]